MLSLQAKQGKKLEGFIVVKKYLALKRCRLDLYFFSSNVVCRNLATSFSCKISKKEGKHFIHSDFFST